MINNFITTSLQTVPRTRTMITYSIFFTMRYEISEIAKAKAKTKAKAITRKRFLWSLSHMQKYRDQTKSLKGLL